MAQVRHDKYIGKEVLGQYFIERKLGEGGMGAVYLADQPSMARKAALKILRVTASEDDQVQRFRREAQALAQLDHPNIVKVYTYQTLDDGSHCMAMEFVQGQGMDVVLEQNGPLPWQRAVNITCQAADALMEAHSHSIVHRDLKPENILLTERRGQEDFVKVLDFGIAKVLENTGGLDSSKTIAGVIHGTPMYMSPEQARGEELDHRSDIYSLGICLFVLMTCELPIKSNTLVGYIIAHQQDPPPPLCEYVPDAPKELEHIVAKMLQKNPDARYQSMHEVMYELRQLLDNPNKSRSGGGGKLIKTVALLTVLTLGSGLAAYLLSDSWLPLLTSSGGSKKEEVVTGPRVLEASTTPKPQWVSRLPFSHDRTFFLGEGVGQSLTVARERAVISAQAKFMHTLARDMPGDGGGMVLKNLIDKVLEKEEEPVREAMTRFRYKLDETDDTYWERFVEEQGKSPEYRYMALFASKYEDIAEARRRIIEPISLPGGFEVLDFFPMLATVFEENYGLLVVDLTGRRAQRSQLQAGDLVVRIAGEPSRDLDVASELLHKGLKSTRGSSTIPIEIRRLVNNKVQRVEVDL